MRTAERTRTTSGQMTLCSIIMCMWFRAFPAIIS
jgi:hypothetical protein